MSIWTEPSPSDFDRIEARVVGGEKPFDAARAEGFTLSACRRANPIRHADLLELGRQEQQAFAIDNLRAIASDRDHKDTVRANELVLRDAGGLTDRVEVSGRDGAPIEVEDRSAPLELVAGILQRSGAFAAILERESAREPLPAAPKLLAESEHGERAADGVPAS